MGLGAVHLSVIDDAGEAGPWVLTQNAPFRQHFSFRRQLDDHVQSRVGDQQVAVGSRSYVVKIIETGQRDMSNAPEFRQFKNQHLR